MDILARIESRARRLGKRILFPEDEDDRILKAVAIIAKKRIAIPVLLGERSSIEKKLPGSIVGKVEIIDTKSLDYEEMAARLYDIRKEKGLTISEAKTLLNDKMYLAAMLLKDGRIDGIVSGAAHPTEHTLRPAFQIIKTKPGVSIASGCFLMIHKMGNFIFSDCGVNPNPDENQLAEISKNAAEFAIQLGIKPRIAMLSFSTLGSASHPLVEKVKNAVRIASEKMPNLLVEGELQVDAAIVPEVAKRKAPGSKIRGRANVLIFPDLNAGNIGYKLVERFGGARAVGPIIVGLARPVNDLSRGCSVQDIVEVAAITAVQAGEE
ncbi:MAG: phosphate acetyltransferase [Candidatus Woesearchaeota archaeon]